MSNTIAAMLLPNRHMTAFKMTHRGLLSAAHKKTVANDFYALRRGNPTEQEIGELRKFAQEVVRWNDGVLFVASNGGKPELVLNAAPGMPLPRGLL